MANMQTVFINPERCIGCRQCEFACAVAHSQSKDPALALAEDPVPKSRIHISPGWAYNLSIPSLCRHCDPAPCEQVCPTGAMARDAGYDLVVVDVHRCIACAMCAMVCPFDAVTFYAQADGMPKRVVATKCDGCVERLDNGQQPACVEACKVDALLYGELNTLIASGRLKATAAVLAATASQLALDEPPATVSGWRQWGECAAHISEELTWKLPTN
jgi:anaerobic carbon-monoxide dehydrogenase iron sulfur subunit